MHLEHIVGSNGAKQMAAIKHRHWVECGGRRSHLVRNNSQHWQTSYATCDLIV